MQQWKITSVELVMFFLWWFIDRLLAEWPSWFSSVVALLNTAFFCWLWETCNLDRERMINSYWPAFFLQPGHSFHVAVLLFQSSAVLSCHKMLLALSRTHNKQLGLLKSQCKMNQTWKKKKVILISLWSTASLVDIMKTCKTLPSYCRN